MSVTLSLVTGAMNRPLHFQRLVDSIVKHTTVDWELVVADASTAPMVSDCPNVRLLREWPRAGCVKGYNRAFREALGKWVIWLNDDCEVEAGYDSAIRWMEHHGNVGLGALYYRDHEHGYRVSTAWGMVYANFGIIRRQVGDQLGWFDEDLTMYGNDNSLAFRVLLSGRGVAPVPGARIFHNVIHDRDKLQNQALRRPDGHVLTRKYHPRLKEMKAVYQNTEFYCRELTA